MKEIPINAEGWELARKFHEVYERLAPTFGYATRAESAKPWGEVPLRNKQLMAATCTEILKGESREPEKLNNAHSTNCTKCGRPLLTASSTVASGMMRDLPHYFCTCVALAESSLSSPPPKDQNLLGEALPRANGKKQG